MLQGKHLYIILSAVAFVILVIVALGLSHRFAANTELTGQTVKETVSEVSDNAKAHIKFPAKSCDVVICEKDGEEIYCPDFFDICRDEYDDCRIVWCEGQKPEKKKVSASESAVYVSADYVLADDECTEVYNDCINEAGEEIICHGGYEDCVNAFPDCSCGNSGSEAVQRIRSSDQEGSDSTTLDFNQDTKEMEQKNLACDTGIFLCKKKAYSISGDYVSSTVECKGSYAQCVRVYGECVCGNTTLEWFDKEDAVDWCAWNGMQARCDMIYEDAQDCKEKRQTCDKGNGIMVTCDGSLVYCNSRYDDRCLCGIEMDAVKKN